MEMLVFVKFRKLGKDFFFFVFLDDVDFVLFWF